MTDTTDSNGVQTLTKNGDPSQIIPPDSDSGMRIRGIRADRLAAFLPGVLLVIAGGYIASFGRLTWGGGIAGVGVVTLIVGGYYMWTTPAHTAAIDRLRGRIRMAFRSRSLPLDRGRAADVHGVERILDDGSVEMHDGRVVRFARVHGRNTDYQTTDEQQSMGTTLRKDLDATVDFDWSVYSPSSSPDSLSLTEKYRDVWLSERFENSSDVLGYLEAIVEGEPQVAESWKATEWEYYLVVSVAPNEVEASEIGSGGAVARAQAVEAESRIAALREVFGSVPGINAHPIPGAESARLIARHWAGTRSPDGLAVHDGPATVAPDIDSEAGERPSAPDDLSPLDPSLRERVGIRVRSLAEGLRGDEPTPPNPALSQGERIKELLAASYWDERPSDDLVVAGDQYCRTFYIAEWPSQAVILFLKELHTLRGIDASVHLRFDNRETESVKEEIEQEAGSIDASVTERKRNSSELDASVLEEEMDAHVTLYKIFHHTDIQPWEMSMFVTVRAGDRTALSKAVDLIERGYDEGNVGHDLSKRMALEDACEDVRDVLTSAELEPATDPTWQRALFRSASPTGRNAYVDETSRAKKRLCGTGSVAATFPPCSTSIQHDRGVEVGRNPTNGRVIAIDPFETPPAHKLVLGKSGSGKTWATNKQIARWYLTDPDHRTVVLIDNKQGFAGITGLLNGDTIPLGGTTTMNPLRMQPMDPEMVEQTRLDPFAEKHRFVTGLVLDLIAETDDARDRFRPLLRDGIRTAMVDAGLDPNDPSTHLPEHSPTMADVRQAVEAIGANPEAHVRTGFEASEIEAHAGALLRRLSGFSEDGEFSFLTGESDATVEPGSVTYLDLKQGGLATDRTTMLSVALGEVYEAVKRAEGETLFVIDEAHHLLKSPRILQWLEESARHWRHNTAGLWFVSQHPKDFAAAEDADEQQNKNVIRDQAQITEIFRTDDDDALAEFGLNSEQIEFVTDEATMGETSSGRSECLIDHPEIQGWLQAVIRLTDAEHSIFSYDPEKHGSYTRYIDRNWSRNSDLATDGGER